MDFRARRAPEAAPEVLIRADGGVGIGAGHVERCLNLARGLRELGAQVGFLSALLDPTLRVRVESAGFAVQDLPEDPEAHRAATLAALADTTTLVVDHYGVTEADEAAFAAQVECLVSIEDLPGRRHPAHVLLDQTFGRSAQDYAGCVTPGTTLLLGTPYALLRPEFRTLRGEARARRERAEARNLLISFGGSNPDDVVVRLAELLVEHGVHKTFEIRLVEGLALDSRDSARLRELLGADSCLTGHVTNMPELVQWADVAIGAGGVSTWERCTLGLPTVLVTVADNQRQIACNVIEEGAALDGGGIELDEATILAGLERLRRDAGFYRATASRAFGVCDGAGVERASAAILRSAAARAESKAR
jgi:UDP-2,4-diacetamido-2,4,6-trideoxy-beta-L-altropyranose hydrolase